MNFNFSEEEILFIYGHFIKEVKKLENLKTIPNCPIDSESIMTDIKLYSSIISKLEISCPQLSKLKTYL